MVTPDFDPGPLAQVDCPHGAEVWTLVFMRDLSYSPQRRGQKGCRVYKAIIRSVAGMSEASHTSGHARQPAHDRSAQS
ncbi:MAG: hypothetical protein ABI227_10005 [Rhodanobacter sp.]